MANAMLGVPFDVKKGVDYLPTHIGVHVRRFFCNTYFHSFLMVQCYFVDAFGFRCNFVCMRLFSLHKVVFQQTMAMLVQAMVGTVTHLS